MDAELQRANDNARERFSQIAEREKVSLSQPQVPPTSPSS
jgi:hypothetical protein